MPESRVGRGITAQVALARRISPHQAERWVGFAMIAPKELPHAFAALAAGETSEWRAIVVTRDTAWPSHDHRAEVDRLMAPRLSGLGDRSTADETRKRAYILDPSGDVDHLTNAEADRHVSLRPALDVMTGLGALLPVAQGVPVRAALGRAADIAEAAGDTRTRGQIMADTLVERCTGQATADAVGIEVQVVLPADVLFADTVGPTSDITEYVSTAAASPPASLDAARQRRIRRRRRARDRRRDPALLIGYGPIPAAIARGLLLDRSAHAPDVAASGVPVPRHGPARLDGDPSACVHHCPAHLRHDPRPTLPHRTSSSPHRPGHRYVSRAPSL